MSTSNLDSIIPPIGGDVPAGDSNTFFRQRFIHVFDTVAEVQGEDLSKINRIRVVALSANFNLATLSTEAHDGTTVLVDSAGNRFLRGDTLTGVIMAGSGAPSTALGAENDGYIDADTFVFYWRGPTDWTAGGNLMPADGADGQGNWLPEFAVVGDGPDRQVLRVVDWSNGTGAKPPVGQYLGSGGLVADIAQGVDISGSDGNDGAAGQATDFKGVGAPASGLGVDDQDYLDLANGETWQKAAGVWGVIGSFAVNGLLGVGTDAEIEAAYTLGTPAFIIKGASPTLEYDSAKGHDLADRCAWFARRNFDPRGTESIVVADGFHVAGQSINFRKPGHLKLEAASSPHVRNIKAITTTAIADQGLQTNLRRATIEIADGDADLPDIMQSNLDNLPIGLRDIWGNNDAPALSGGHQLETVFADRRRFTVDFIANPGATGWTDPTAFYASPFISDVNNTIAIPRAAIIFPDTTWPGASQEGAIEVWNGFLVHLKRIGLAYRGLEGANGSHHDFLMAKFGGGFYMEDDTVVAGAGQYVLRSDEGWYRIIGSQIGGSRYADGIYQDAQGGVLRGIKTSFCSARQDGILGSTGSRISIAQGGVSLARSGVRSNSVGCDVIVDNASIYKCVTGIENTFGEVRASNEVHIGACGNGTKGAIQGSEINFMTGNQANTQDAVNP